MATTYSLTADERTQLMLVAYCAHHVGDLSYRQLRDLERRHYGAARTPDPRLEAAWRAYCAATTAISVLLLAALGEAAVIMAGILAGWW